MSSLVKIVILFLAITGAATILINVFQVDFGNVDYWQNHGIFMLFFLAVFPRLTLFFSSIPFGGFFWWIGFIFAPRILIAVLATISYWHTNQLLVIASWLVALGAESGEKYYVRRQIVVVRDNRINRY